MKVMYLPAKGRNVPEGERCSYATQFSAAFDLRAQFNHTLMPGERVKIPTALYIIGGEYEREYLQILPRSGLAINHGIDTLAGVVDSDYRSEICVILINHSNVPYSISEGDKIAQAVLSKIDRVEGIPVEQVTRDGGFGSTGKW